ncbi:plexin domain-containing protein 1-like [Bradysia coprophila]|uniref:plexin domain-containing protein 1-like n=1 Tax=Bradysia coprophila TaxID=38358 RepID=UPI00187DC318|nr:plexin domain-containing protein 1-like [Bradysia coprophila]
MARIRFVLLQSIVINLIFFAPFSTSTEFSDNLGSSHRHETSENDEQGNNIEINNKTTNTQTSTQTTPTKTFESIYYNSEIMVNKTLSDEYWSDGKNFTVSQLLSTSVRRAIEVPLTFAFPYYGDPLHNIIIASGGFLFTGGRARSSLTRMQYIAPLMMNFNASLSNVTTVKYSDNGTAFTVVWEKIPLQEKANKILRLFTFGVTIHESGHITFAYRVIPVPLNENLSSVLKVGLSDGYSFYKKMKPLNISFLRADEYDVVKFDWEYIQNETLIYNSPRPTCLQHTNCEACVQPTENMSHRLKCSWCQAAKCCSSRSDRNKKEWDNNTCLGGISDAESCPAHNVSRFNEHTDIL